MESPLTGGAEALELAVVLDVEAGGVGAVAQDFSNRLPAIVDPNRRKSRRPNLLLITPHPNKLQETTKSIITIDNRLKANVVDAKAASIDKMYREIHFWVLSKIFYTRIE